MLSAALEGVVKRWNTSTDSYGMQQYAGISISYEIQSVNSVEQPVLETSVSL